MDAFYDFLIEHWRLIVVAVLLFANLLLTIFKRPKVISTLFEGINSIAPTAINEAEKLYGNGNGSNKLDYAVKFVVDYLVFRFNIREDVAKKYTAVIKTEIEKILSTPQKKEGV